ncbi:SagB/ThcOx family dehydrogenase [Gracilibacillus caseinilyticus]|uniref:SagB/ThcOx family dehydrogenase n=1 Tax=Gracilibacillus caseinilyticus TaxID=2932256 RepID=A0ABY4EZY2_9BACI|nr:SagB/ThcOx family dehydrogenase [Gracilibacillus caseinilyticus]UOQ49505.1 SagB/ThcOx family dehydrogenase [Gracilibacillus caseinilyticus]
MDLKKSLFNSRYFHENSKLFPRTHQEEYIKNYPILTERPKFKCIKEYDFFQSTNLLDEIDFYQTLRKRRTSRSFEVRSVIAYEKLKSILTNSYGITKENEKLRSVPSGGARFPIYIYIFIFNVSELEKGIYIYIPEENKLGLLYIGDFRDKISNCIARPYKNEVEKCSFITVSVSNFLHSCEKYGERGYRLALLDCGHISQNLYLTSTAEKISCRALAGFYDNKLNELLLLNEDFEEAILVHLFGIEQESLGSQFDMEENNYYYGENNK